MKFDSQVNFKCLFSLSSFDSKSPDFFVFRVRQIENARNGRTFPHVRYLNLNRYLES